MVSAVSSPDVAIIGAGAAGLGAWRALAGSGLQCSVLEARPRPGGRAWSVRLEHGAGAGFIMDMGCGWLHSADVNPYVPLARGMGFAIDESTPPWQRETPEEFFPASDHGAFRQAQALFEARIEAAATQAPDRPAGDLLEPDCRWNGLLDAISTYVNGAELAHISTHDLASYHDSEINYRVRAGYGTLIAAIGQGAPLAAGCPVSRIRHGGARITVETARGTVSARAVIVTLPTSVLAAGGIAFDPPLPDKLEAAAGLPLGHNNKLFLAVGDAEGLPDGGFAFGRRDRADCASYHFRPFGAPLIEAYFGGALARDLEAGGLAAFADHALAELTDLLGSDWRRRIVPVSVSNWSSDEFAQGSYSHALPCHADKRAILAAPVDGRIFFAGEATSPHFFSTAHGAYESGVRAAGEVLVALGVTAPTADAGA